MGAMDRDRTPLLHLIGSVTAFVVVAEIAGGPYRALLAQIVGVILTRPGDPVSLTHLAVLAPLDLALFAGLVTAAHGLPRRTRLLALLFGIPILFAVEVLSSTASVWTVIQASRGHDLSPAVQLLRSEVMAGLPLASAFLLWRVVLPPTRSSKPETVQSGAEGGVIGRRSSKDLRKERPYRRRAN